MDSIVLDKEADVLFTCGFSPALLLRRQLKTSKILVYGGISRKKMEDAGVVQGFEELLLEL